MNCGDMEELILERINTFHVCNKDGTIVPFYGLGAALDFCTENPGFRVLVPNTEK